MPQYRVKPGYTHGTRDQYKAGDIVQHTEQEAAGFLDKLELVTVGPSVIDSQNVTGASNLPQGGLLVTPAGAENATPPTLPTDPKPQGGNDTPPTDTPPEPFDVADATVEEVLAAVQEGKVTAGDALIAEQQSKKRTTLIAELTKLVEAEQAQKPQE